MQSARTTSTPVGRMTDSFIVDTPLERIIVDGWEKSATEILNTGGSDK